jgi:hypothetical protein
VQAIEILCNSDYLCNAPDFLERRLGEVVRSGSLLRGWGN